MKPKPRSRAVDVKEPAAPEPERATAPAAELSRLAIPIRSDGSVAVDRMRESTKAQLAGLMKDAGLAKSLGIAGEGLAAPGLPPQLMKPLVHTLSQLQVILVARMTAAPANIVLRIAPYTPDEHAMIEPALASVLDKYAGSLFSTWGDEIGLALLLVTIAQSKVQAVQEAVRSLPATVHPMRVPDRPAVTDAEPIAPESES
jgi:hypothetical protein